MAAKFTTKNDGSLAAIPERVYVTRYIDANSVDQNVFIADLPYYVETIREVHSVAGGSSAAVVVKKCTGTTAVASGTALHSTAVDLTATAETVASVTITAATADRKLAAGDRLSLDFSGTLTGLIGVVEIGLRKLRTAGGSV